MSASTEPRPLVDASGPEPAHPSEYVDDAFYQLLRDDLVEWRAAGTVPEDRPAIETFLLHEAWLLDQGRYEDWFGLLTDDCLYWVPASPEPGDPQTQVTIACDDRRRLGDRIGWLRTMKAWAQIPPSLTSHLLGTPVEIPTAVPGERKFRSAVVVHETRPGSPPRALAGWCGHVLRGEEPRIVRKIVVLTDADHGHRNLSFLL